MLSTDRRTRSTDQRQATAGRTTSCTNRRTLVRAEPLESRTLLSPYYVSPSGLDASAGTESAPWKTLSHGLAAVQAGDTLVLRAGTYPGGVTIDTPNLTVSNYPGERP